MNRIEKKFDELKKKDEKALIPYIVLGEPSAKKTVEIIHTLEKSGADMIELGIPYSDPLADGPVIEAAGLRSIQNGFKLKDAFEIVSEVRKTSQIPLIFMCYYNTIFGYGKEKFIKNCKECGIDGLIIPDLPIEEREEIAPDLKETEISLIPLAAVTSKDRIPQITKYAQGFTYCVSSLGVTGERRNFYSGVNEFLTEAKNSTSVPICVGFGISTKADVKQFAQYADGVIVGSAIVRKIYETDCDCKQIGAFIEELKSGTK